MAETEANSSRRRQRISDEKKKMLLHLIYETGVPINEAAKTLALNINSAHSIVKRYRADGEEFVKKNWGSHKKSTRTPEVLEVIEGLVENNPSITLKKIQTELQNKGIALSLAVIHKALTEDLKVTLKLVRCEVQQMNSDSTIALRKCYASDFISNAPRKKQCIFIDESGFNLHLRRSFARSKKNERAVTTVPTSRVRNITLIAAMCNKGVVHTNIISNSTCNSEKFCTFLKEIIEMLDQRSDMADTWLIMDNAAIHKTRMVADIVKEKPYHLKFLSPYSPMLNPIENMFSKMKLIVRAMLSETANGSLVNCIEQAVDQIKGEDCEGYVKHMLENLEKAKDGQSFT